MTSLEGSRKNYSFRVTLQEDLLPSIVSKPSNSLSIIFSSFEIIAYIFPEEDRYYYNPIRPITYERFIIAPGKLLGEDSITELIDMFNRVNVPLDYHVALKRQIECITRDMTCTTGKTRFSILVEIKVTGLYSITDPNIISSDAVCVIIPRSIREESNGEAPDVLPASKSSIEELERVSAEEIAGNDDRTCAICLDEFLVNAEVISMPCSHRYHGTCIFPWLEKSNLCPMCRFEMPVDESLD